ncbi:pyridoxamine 5'-phosphate oxidase family protein [Streptomyces sulphureus]|uniref:pyridoxamine 5'-phosphate oxidase family protein n=1 Tax=Streptomyces sulphureus TaxID=47758 RepID=UPI00036349CF|nr:pyridoxamine 5'-phosphate oxidase family protein [Streptomyces sulphureus]
MGKTYPGIEGRLRDFILAQPVFFTATAPLSPDGTVNLSPKGLSGSLAVLDPHTLAYLDFAGSNAETLAHLRENGRITLMWCAFRGPPTIVRVHGTGEPVFRDDPRFVALLDRFTAIDPADHGLRAIVLVHAELVRDTCGFAVPLMEYVEDRTLHGSRFAREDDASLDAYFHGKEHVARSIDGLPGLPLPLPPSPTTDAGKTRVAEHTAPTRGGRRRIGVAGTDQEP